VACNGALVAAVRDRLPRAEVYAPTPRLATDNAAMIARAGLFRLERGERSDLGLSAWAVKELPGVLRAGESR
jgi:N6-L-threonylcarbamoyladenine synthase